jgi:hypothetical protein
MAELPKYLARGERARLFPVLADTSKEGRSTSILLACLSNVREFGQAMLSSIGQRAGKRAVLAAYTEIGFAAERDKKTHRPDGLIVLTVGNREWRAFVETKVGSNELYEEQISAYLDLAKSHGVDAVITVSNQFTAAPTQHPIKLPARTRGKVELYHWSWMYILTQADLLVSNESIEDEDQHFILNEMIRFLTHPSAGVKGFDSMPPAWTDVVQKVTAGAPLQAKSDEVQDVVAAWHQEVRDLTLILSRQIGVEVQAKLPRSHALDQVVRAKADAAQLTEAQCLTAILGIPDAAAPIELSVDIGKRTISASMMLRAPSDKKSTKARLNWLLRQLKTAPEKDLYIRLHWPGRGAHTQHTLAELRENPDFASENHRDNQAHSFEICMLQQLAGRFGQRKNFISDVEQAVPSYYETVGQHLRAYQSPAPRIREDRSDPESVTIEGLQIDAEEETLGESDP